MPEPAIPPSKRLQHPSPYAAKLVAKETGKSKASIQLPKDIRMQFPPRSTQLTESAVKWISAYALHVLKDPTLVVNLRVSYQDWAIQQARLGLILQIMICHIALYHMIPHFTISPAGKKRAIAYEICLLGETGAVSLRGSPFHVQK